MPYKLVDTGNGFGVRNTETGDMKSSGTTRERAESQMRLLQAIKHGWTPADGKKRNAIGQR